MFKLNALQRNTVLSPPCGMETPMPNFLVSIKYLSSKPTVWDGDWHSSITNQTFLPVLSPLCGMETLLLPSGASKLGADLRELTDGKN